MRNRTKEGLIPTVLGTAVTATGFMVKKSRPSIGWGIVGFGLAHIVLGTIDMFEHNR